MTTTTLCRCGLPEQHYNDEGVRLMVASLVAEQGADVPIVYDGVTYLVPRHYIALHGIKATDLSTLGFPTRDTHT